MVFKLAPRQGGGWTYSVLYAFAGKPGLGSYGGLTLEKTGNLYGTTWNCAVGQQCVGTVFAVTP